MHTCDDSNDADLHNLLGVQDGERLPVCPYCKSKEVVPYRHPKTGRLVTRKGSCLWLCTVCRETFAEDAESALVLDAKEHAETTIATDRRCPECGYNLRTLRVGNRCPECGAKILRRSVAAFVEAKGRRGGWFWANVLMVITWISMAVLGSIYEELQRLELALILVALWIGGYGVKGLATGAIAPSPKGYDRAVWTGLLGRVCSVVYILLGLSFLVLAIALWLGWVK